MTDGTSTPLRRVAALALLLVVPVLGGLEVDGPLLGAALAVVVLAAWGARHHAVVLALDPAVGTVPAASTTADPTTLLSGLCDPDADGRPRPRAPGGRRPERARY